MNTFDERKRKRSQNLEVLETFCREFKERFQTPGECMAELWKLFRLCELQCTRCGNQLKTGIERSVACPLCHKMNWVTAQTVLHHVGRPDVWLAIIFLKGSGIPFSSSMLAKLLGSAIPTVKNARLKFAIATTDWMKEEEPLRVHSAEMIETYNRRSMETPYHQHPRAEQEEMERRAREEKSVVASMHETTAINIDDSDTRSPVQTHDELSNKDSGDPAADATANASEPKPLVVKLLEDGPLHFDVLAAKSGLDVGTLNFVLTILELDGEIQVVGFGMFALKRAKQSQKEPLAPDIPEFVRGFIEFIKIYHHGISRKYVQLYMASYWYHLCRRSFPPLRLTAEWLARGHVSTAELMSYVSPLETIVGTLRLNALRVLQV